MTKAELEQYREQLLSMQSRVRGDVSHLKGEALRTSDEADNPSGVPTDMADIATDNFEQELSLSLLANQHQVLEDIASALKRVEQGTFGRCEECQEPIVRLRLKELPYTPYCVSCARKLEQRREHDA